MPQPYTLQAYTDGACRVSRGDGGWAVVFVRNNEIVDEHSIGPVMLTTNNRMELSAAIDAVRSFCSDESLRCDDVAIEVMSDSKYVVDAISKGWIDTWRVDGRLNEASDCPVKNLDLWCLLESWLEKCKSKHMPVIFTHVKGHADDPFNDRADELAVARSRGKAAT